MKQTFTLLILLVFTLNTMHSQGTFKEIDAILKQHSQQNPEIGMSIGYIHNSKKQYVSYGYLNRENKQAVNINTVFEIASITKIITANLIAQAVLENKLNLADYIDAYLPKEYVLHKNLIQKIKISDLASHQSGLPDIDFGELIEKNNQQPTSIVNLKMLTNLVNNCQNLKDYGIYRYNTLGYTLLGHVLESIYNKEYAQIVEEKIFSVTQMNNSLTDNFNVTDNMATGYNPKGGKQEVFKWNIVASAGLLKSNAYDMTLYLDALLKNSHIGKAAKLTEDIFYNEKERKIGLGIVISKDEKNTYYYKSGDSMGQSSILAYNRDKSWGIIILLNERNHPLKQKILNDIYENVLK